MARNINQNILFHALQLYGERELPGGKSNPWILQLIQRHFPRIFDDGGASWCGLFMEEVMHRSCGLIPEKPALARNWMKVGEEVTRNPLPGDVVVLWRESERSWKGHVGIYIRERDDQIYLLGGNQSNAVNIRAYKSERILGIYRHYTPLIGVRMEYA